MGVFNRRRYTVRTYISQSVPLYSGKKCRVYVIAIKSHITWLSSTSILSSFRLYTSYKVVVGCRCLSEFVIRARLLCCNRSIKPTGFPLTLTCCKWRLCVSLRGLSTSINRIIGLMTAALVRSGSEPSETWKTMWKKWKWQKEKTMAQKHECRSHFSIGLYVYLLIFA